MDNVTSMDEHREQEQPKVPDVSEGMGMLTAKIRFLEAATMALGGDSTNDPDYYMAGLSNILEEIGDDAQEMFQKLYG
ncbi:MAG: hypothetical protein R6U55_11015 [Desulfovermiculus sp.]